MSMLSDFFKAAPIRDAAADPLRYIASFAANWARPSISYKQVIEAEAAMCHPFLYRCLNKIALAVQEVSWKAVQDPTPGAKKVSKETLSRIQDVLTDPHDTHTANTLRYWMALNRAAYGRIPFKVGVGAAGSLNAIYPLRTANFRTVWDKRLQVKYYEYGTGDSVDKLPPRREVDPDKVGKFTGPFAYEIVTPNLSGTSAVGANNGKSSLNNSPLSAIGLPAQVMELLLQRAADTASGHPNAKYIVSGEKTMTEPDKKLLRERLEEASTDGDYSGNVIFIGGMRVNVDKLDNDLSDIQSKMPNDDMARMIAGAFNIPVALLGLGAADGAKFASNYAESRHSFYVDTIIPEYLDPIAAGLTRALCPPGAIIVFEVDEIAAIKQYTRDAQVKEAEAADKMSGVTFLTVNEKRAMFGYEPVADGEALDTNSDSSATGPGGNNQPEDS